MSGESPFSAFGNSIFEVDKKEDENPSKTPSFIQNENFQIEDEVPLDPSFQIQMIQPREIAEENKIDMRGNVVEPQHILEVG